MENPNGRNKNGKVQKLEKIKKLNKNDCHKKHIKNVLDNASAAPYKHSTTWLVALQAMSADHPAEADTG